MDFKKAGNVVVAMQLSQPDKVLYSCHLVVISPHRLVNPSVNVVLSHFIVVDAVDSLSHQSPIAITFRRSTPAVLASHKFVHQDGFITIQRVDRPKRKGKRLSDKGKGRKGADGKSKAATK
jgi:hypothetical protein